ncbi:MAG TPA: L-2-hydroxyglutarate oxidase [Actinoplanes sp.]|nr:L-2-hydroxyglutarate oxidase [Actinoplanes sp.]
MRIAVIGGGILGLAVARELLTTRPGAEVVVLEREDAVARHQTGNNSGVVHAGLYYRPGSLKAELCRRGRIQLKEFCAAAGVPYRELGKLVVATSQRELPALRDIFERSKANQVPGVTMVGPERMAEIEPHTRGVAAVHSPVTAVTDFAGVARAMAADVEARGGTVRLGTRVVRLVRDAGGVRVQTETDAERYDLTIACAGLGTDRLARDPRVRTVPFRGQYFRLSEPLRDQVRGLIYPVPDPRYPFLGVHLTRRFDDEVLVGPSAVLAVARDGHRRRAGDLRELLGVLGYPGFWRLARRHWPAGAREIATAASRQVFAALARRYLPGVRAGDLQPWPAGVRAQALNRSGALVDDFIVDASDHLVILRNAPSPAATSSLAIAQHVVTALPLTPPSR